jgi:hypothetical protein
MKKTINFAVAVAFAAILSTTALAQSFDKAQYLKAASPDKKKGRAVGGSIAFDGSRVQFVNAKGAPELSVPVSSVKEVLYERTATPRYTEAVLLSPLFVFSKSKKHYLTIQYADANGGSQYAIVRLDKSNFREALAAAEATTGKKVDRSEER